MNKYTKLALATATGALLLLATSSTLASPSLMKQTSNGAPILTISSITPGGKEMKIDAIHAYVGRTAGCSNLQKYRDDYDDIYIDNETSSLSSEDISEALGDALTCFKIDFVVKDKTYSTGKVALNWDGAEYTSATPNTVTINITQ